MSTQQSLTAIDLQQLQLAHEAEQELEVLAKDDADLRLLSDYSARALTAEGMAAVEERLGRDDGFRALAMTLLGARDVARERVERATEAATASADAAWRRLQDRENRELWGEATHGEPRQPSDAPRVVGEATPRRRARLLLRVCLASIAVVVIAYVGGIAWQFVKASEVLQDRWEVHRVSGELGSFNVRISNLMLVNGLGPAFVAVRRRGVLGSGLGSDAPQEVYAEGSLISVHASAIEGRELQVETPLMTLRTTDAYAIITSQEMGSRVIRVSSGRVVVTLAGEPSRAITIGEGFELAVTADGKVDHTPARGVSGFRRVPVEAYRQ